MLLYKVKENINSGGSVGKITRTEKKNQDGNFERNDIYKSLSICNNPQINF
jgi:hypothetical protein